VLPYLYIYHYHPKKSAHNTSLGIYLGCKERKCLELESPVCDCQSSRRCRRLLSRHRVWAACIDTPRHWI
jgi:hypothetical protein